MAQRAGAGDHKHRDRDDKSVAERRGRADQRPDDKGQNGHNYDGWHEIPRDLIYKLLDRRAAALGVGDHLDDFGQGGVGADFLRAHNQGSGAVDGGSGNLVAFGFFNRHGFAGDHGLVDRGIALDDDPVHRKFVTGNDAYQIADPDRLDRHFFLRPVFVYPQGRIGRQIQHRLDRAAGFFPCPQFEYLAQQDQHDDHGGGFEIEADPAVHVAETLGKGARNQNSRQ